ncbi:MAG TPA: MbnP family protein [Chryseolinea sp.]
MKTNHSIYILFLIFLFATACHSDDPAPGNNDKGTLTLHFDNVAGDEDLTLNTTSYTNASGETFKVTALRYFISNISLKTVAGEVYTVPQDSSYFLVDEAEEESQDLVLKNIPAGDYNAVTFTLGVDSLKSVADASTRTGILDPEATDMYWSKNQGYIFFRMEGTSDAIAGAGKTFAYHIGGYGGPSAAEKTFNNLKKFDLTFGSSQAQVRTTIAPEAHFYIDILKVFNGNTKVSLAEHPDVMFTEYSEIIAGNYASMIAFGHVHNDPKQN